MLPWGMFQKTSIHHTPPQPHSWCLDALPVLRDAAILRGGFEGAHGQAPLILLWTAGLGLTGEQAEGTGRGCCAGNEKPSVSAGHGAGRDTSPRETPRMSK